MVVLPLAHQQVAAELGVSAITVGKWCRQFAESGMSGRPKARPELTDAERDQLTPVGAAGEVRAGRGAPGTRLHKWSLRRRSWRINGVDCWSEAALTLKSRLDWWLPGRPSKVLLRKSEVSRSIMTGLTGWEALQRNDGECIPRDRLLSKILMSKSMMPARLHAPLSCLSE